MSVTKRVLLARPHAFIVNEMAPFLIGAGYEPVRVRSLDELEDSLARTFHGAVISTAVTSALNADAADVFRRVRARAPRLPVVFAGMADIGTLSALAGRAVRGLVPDPRILGADRYAPAISSTAAERDGTFLALRKEDLIAGSARDRALAAVRVYLG